MIRAANRSLKVSLTGRLVAGLLVLGVIGAISAYAISARFAQRAFDRTLFDDVKVLADQVRWVEGSTRISLSPDALIWLLADEGDEVIFRVTDLANHRLLTSNGDLGPLPDLDIAPGEPHFRSVRIGAEQLRVAYVKQPVGPAGATALVEIAETTRKRDSVARSILLGSVSMMSIFVLVAVILVWTGVATALHPLRALEEDAARRSANNLEPLDAGRAPTEVMNLIATFNGMLARVVDAIDAQRAFMANAAHQLKTPMAGLRLQAQLALSAETLEAAYPNLQSVQQRVADSARLIDQLLALAHAESGDTMANARCDLVAITRSVCERLMPQAQARGIDLGMEQNRDELAIAANPLLIGELVSNLVDNALRYGRDAGRVTVRLEARDDQVMLTVSDDGPGFAEGSAPNLFRRFSRSDSAAGHGAGLGLAIVKEIADRYAAGVTVRSRPAVEGASVEVRFKSA